MNDALRGTVAIGRLSTKDNETSLLKIYDAVHIERQENTVRVQCATYWRAESTNWFGILSGDELLNVR